MLAWEQTTDSSPECHPQKALGFDADFSPDHERDRLRALACTVFSQGFVGAKTAPELAFWKLLLPQLTRSIPSVKEAAAAFGASYEHQTLKRHCAVSKLTVARQIAVTVRKLQDDIVRLPFGPLPVLVACVLLACAETIQHRNSDALLHMRGAFAAMSIRESTTPGRDVLQDDDTSYIFQKLDLQVATYALGTGPVLPSLGLERTAVFENVSFTTHTADRALFQALHSCYGFTPRAAKYKYRPYSVDRESLVDEQGHHIANLTAWMSRYRRSCRNIDHRPSDPDQVHGLVLQAQCLSALIYVSNILDPYEAAYDKYAPRFQQIVRCVEDALDANSDEVKLPRFNPEMGVIQPLFFTAIKYRDSGWRARAIALMQKCGQEGPWCSYVETAAAEAVVRAEEGACLASLTKSSGEISRACGLVPSDILEKDRVAGCGIFDFLEGKDGSKKVVIQLGKCRDMESLLACSDPDAEDGEHWPLWHETCDLFLP